MYTVLDAGVLNIRAELRELAPLAEKYGFGGIGVSASLLKDAVKAEEAGRIARDLGLKWGLLPTPGDMFHEGLEGEAFEQALVTLADWAKAGERMGVKYCYNHVWSSNSKREYAENFEWHVKRLERIQSILNDCGIRYGMEFLGPHELRVMAKYPFVHTLAGVLAIADAAGGKSGFLFDTWHWYTGSGREDDLYLAAKNCRRMVGLHLNDGVIGRAREEQRDLERAMPMTTGVIDSARVFGMFREHGFEGPALAEPMEPSRGRYGSMEPEQAVREAAAIMRCVENGERYIGEENA